VIRGQRRKRRSSQILFAVSPKVMSNFTKRLFSFIIPFIVFGCAKPTGVHIFQDDQITRYLRHYGFEDEDVERYWEDTQGHIIYVADKTAIYLLTAENDKPRKISYPTSTVVNSYWIDPDGNIKYLPPYAHREHNNINGLTYLDEQSGYFFQRGLQDTGIIYVGHMARKEGWLFTIQGTDKFSPEQICARGDTIYLLDHGDSYKPSFLHFGNNCWAFAPDPKDKNHYVKIGEFSVPGKVKLVDPFFPRFACNGYGVMPFPGGPFLYDTQAHKNLGRLPDNAMILFLDGDWLSPRLTAKPAKLSQNKE
jgi:hypothetical protein